MIIDQHGLTDQDLEHGVAMLWSIIKTIIIIGGSALAMIPFFNL